MLSFEIVWLGGNATLLLPKSLKIVIKSFTSQYDSKIKIVKRRSTISLQKAIDFCFGSGDNDSDSSRGGLSSGEEYEIDKEMLAEGQWKMER